MSDPAANAPEEPGAAPPGEPLPDKLTSGTRARTLADRRGLSNGFSRPAAAPPAPARPPSRARLALHALGVGPRPIALGLAVGVVLFMAIRAVGAGP